MKKIYSLLLFIMTACAVLPMAVSCSDDDDEDTTVDNSGSSTTVDTSSLEALLSECSSVLAAATTSDYPQSAIDDFSSVITTITSALSSSSLTETQVNNLLIQLQAAYDTFLAASYSAIDDEDLLLCYDFETEGTSLTSTGTLAWVAELTAGPSEVYGSDTSVPTFVDGVGDGKAISFANGSHLEIADYAINSLLGNEVTISVWVNPTAMVDGNYVFSVNYWNTFKLNIQSEGKPFCTVATLVDGASSISDCDNETVESISVGEWTHVVVTVSLTDDQMKFYINGTLTKTWGSDDKPALAGTGWNTYTSTTGTLPIMIGCSTTYAEALAEWSSWASYDSTYWNNNVAFNGAIDNLEIYGIALSDGQVSALYNSEK